MGCLDKVLHANCKIIVILVGMVLFFIWCNVGFVILVMRNYLNHESYHLDLYIQIPFDFMVLLILKYTPSLCLYFSFGLVGTIFDLLNTDLFYTQFSGTSPHL